MARPRKTAAGVTKAAAPRRVSTRPPPPLGQVLWEVSRECPVGCGACRHSSWPAGTGLGQKGDLSTDQAVKMIDQMAVLGASLVFTGPEPLVRPDLFDLADYARTRSVPVTLQTSGTRFDVKAARRSVETKVRLLVVALDGSSGRAHDGFRQAPGAFIQAIKGLDLCKLAGLKFRIATTVTRQNVQDLPKVLSLAQKLGAVGHEIFYNIPAGRGVHVPGDPLDDHEYMESLDWIFEQETKAPGFIHLHCSPQYERIYRMRASELPDHMNPFKPGNEHKVKDHGCPAGRKFMFVAHDGQVYPCAYLLKSLGRFPEVSLADIWGGADLLGSFRAPDQIGGKCHRCKFLGDCRGCRAMAEVRLGDPLAEDPTCTYQPGLT